LIISKNSQQKGLKRFVESIQIASIVTLASGGFSVVDKQELILTGSNSQSQSQTTVLKLSGGSQDKFGPGARARQDAKKNAANSRSSSVVEAFVPQNAYCNYHKDEKPCWKGQNQWSPFQHNRNEVESTSQAEEYPYPTYETPDLVDEVPDFKDAKKYKHRDDFKNRDGSKITS